MATRYPQHPTGGAGWVYALGDLLAGFGQLKQAERQRYLGRLFSRGQDRPLTEKEQRRGKRATGRAGGGAEGFEALRALGLPMEERPEALAREERTRTKNLADWLAGGDVRQYGPTELAVGTILGASPEQKMWRSMPLKAREIAALKEHQVPTQAEMRKQTIEMEGKLGTEARAKTAAKESTRRLQIAETAEARAAEDARTARADRERQGMANRIFARGLREGGTPEIIEALGKLNAQDKIDALVKRDEQRLKMKETYELKEARKALDRANAAFRATGGPIPEPWAQAGYAGAVRMWGHDEQAVRDAMMFQRMWTTPDEVERQMLRRKAEGTEVLWANKQAAERAERELEHRIDRDDIMTDMAIMDQAMAIQAEERFTWPEGREVVMERLRERLAKRQAEREAPVDYGSGPAVGSAASSAIPPPTPTARGLQTRERQPRGTAGAGAAKPEPPPTSAVRLHKPTGKIVFLVGTPRRGEVTIEFPDGSRRTVPRSQLTSTSKPFVPEARTDTGIGGWAERLRKSTGK